MAKLRLLGIDLPKDKKLVFALTAIHGIGIKSAQKLVQQAGINLQTRTKDLTVQQQVTIRQQLENSSLNLEGELRRFNGLNIKRLSEINCFRGQRHRNNLPVRGQRTRTNSRTIRKVKNFMK